MRMCECRAKCRCDRRAAKAGARAWAASEVLAASAASAVSAASRLAVSAALLSVALLSACTVGPDFKTPDAQLPAHYHDTQRASSASPLAAPGIATPRTTPSTVTQQADIDPQWWHSFHDPMLDALIADALAGNLDLQEAVLRIAEARAQVLQAGAQGLPSLNATASYNREQLGLEGILKSKGVFNQTNALASNSTLNGLSPGAGAQLQQGANNLLNQLTQPINIFQVGFDASWELDLFGRVRRSVESANAQTEARIANSRDAMLSLEAEVAQTYAQLRGAQQLRQVTIEQIAVNRQILDLTRNRQQHGLENQSAVESAAGQMTSDQAQIPHYDQQIAQAMSALAVLTGTPPGTLDQSLADPGTVLREPPVVPIGLPSTLARRRPDIRAAEANLHAATAQVGVSVAQLYPDVSLTGQFGTRATRASYLTEWASHFYSFGPSVSLPIFQGGALVASVRLAKTQQAEAALEYRKTVLDALRDIDDALVAYRSDQARRDALDQTDQANEHAYELASEAYRHGIVSFITVLDAQRQATQARQQLTSADTQVITDLVSLYKALGGGWEDASENGNNLHIVH